MDTPPPFHLQTTWSCQGYIDALVRRDGLHHVVRCVAKTSREITARYSKTRTRDYSGLATELLERVVEYLSMVPDPPGDPTG